MGRPKGLLFLTQFLLLSLLPFLGIRPVFSQVVWQRTYGGSNSDVGHAIQQTHDGGYIIAGHTASFNSKNGDVYLIRTKWNGDTIWTRYYGGPRFETGWSVQETRDEGFIISGKTNSTSSLFDALYLIKTDARGDSLWSKVHYLSGWDVGFSIQETQDNGFIIAGRTAPPPPSSSFDVLLLKADAQGDTLWTKTYGGAKEERGFCVQRTHDDGFIVVGRTYSYGAGSWDVYLIKTDSLGDTLWTKTYGGAFWEEGHGVQQTREGGYIIVGRTNSFGAGNDDVYMIKTDARGDTLWTRTFGGIGYDYGLSVQQTQDEGYIIAGYTDSFGAGLDDVYLIKTDSRGDVLWTRTYGGPNYDYVFSVQQTHDGGYIVAGYTDSFGAGDYDVFVIKTDAEGNSGVTQESGLFYPPHGRLIVIPNPFTSFATLPGHEAERFNLYDVSGRKVGTYKGNRIGEGLRAGVYFLRPEGKDAKPLRVVKLR